MQVILQKIVRTNYFKAKKTMVFSIIGRYFGKILNSVKIKNFLKVVSSKDVKFVSGMLIVYNSFLSDIQGSIPAEIAQILNERSKFLSVASFYLM